jgi:hypothetical protein
MKKLLSQESLGHHERLLRSRRLKYCDFFVASRYIAFNKNKNKYNNIVYIYYYVFEFLYLVTDEIRPLPGSGYFMSKNAANKQDSIAK